MSEITIMEAQSSALLSGITAAFASEIMLDIFAAAAAAGISVDMISNSPSASDTASYGFSFADSDMPKILTIVGGVVEKCEKRPKMSISCGHVKFAVNSDMQIGFAERVFAALHKCGCVPLLFSSGLNEISFITDDNCLPELKAELEAAFASKIT